MPSPLEQIKEGILKNDLKLVAAGYKGLTGQDVAPVGEEPPKKRGRPKKSALVLPGDDEYDEVINEERRQQTFEAPARGNRQQPVIQQQIRKRQSRYEEVSGTNKGQGFNKQAKREPVNPQKIQNVGNLFVDDLTIDTSDRKKWQKAYPKGHVSRGREAEQLVRVKCARCRDVLELYRSEIVNNPFICNECTTSVGR